MNTIETIEPRPIVVEPVLFTSLSKELLGKSPASSILHLKKYVAIDWMLNERRDAKAIDRILINSIKYN